MSLNNLGLGFLFTAKDLASGVMGDVKKNLLEVEGAGTAAAKQISESFKAFGTGLAVMGVGIAGLAVLDPAVESAFRFGQAIKLVSTLVSEAQFPMERMKDLSNDLSAQFGVMPVDEAKALYQAVADGAHDAATAQGLLTAANALAVGTQTDLSTALATVSQVGKVFNVSLEDSADVADALFVAAKHTSGGVAGMSEMLEHLGPTAAAAGMSMEELLASIAQLDVAGIRGRPALGGMKAVIESLIAPSQAAKAEAARLGIAFDTATIQARGLPGVLEDINASGRMNDQTLEKMFGSTEAATVAMGLMRNDGKDLAAIMKEVAGSTGAAAQAAEKMVDPTKRFAALKDQVLTLIGEALLPLQRQFYTLVNAVLEGFTKLDPSIVSFVTYLFAGVSVLAVVVGGVMAVTAAMALLSAGAAAAGITVGGLAASIWAAFWPVAIVAAVAALAIAGFKIAFDENLGGIADTARAVWGDLKLTFTALSELFSGGGFTEDTWQKLEEHSGIRTFAILVYTWVAKIENFFSGIGSAFMASVEFIAPLLSALGSDVEILFDAFGDLFGPNGIEGAATSFDLLGDAGEVLGVVLGVVFTALTVAIDLIVVAVHGIVAAVEGAFGILKSLFGGIIDIFYGVVELFDGIVHGDWSKAWSGLKMIAFGAIDGILGMLLSFAGVFGGVIDSIAGAFGKKLNLQKDVEGFKDSMHNNMAKDFGVANQTGLRAVVQQSETPGLVSMAIPAAPSPIASYAAPAASFEASPGAASNPMAAVAQNPFSAASKSLGYDMPAAAAAAASTAPAPDPRIDTMTSSLQTIAANTDANNSAPLNVTLMVDSEAIARATTKAKKGSETRNFTPAAPLFSSES